MLHLAVLDVAWDKSWRKIYVCIPDSELDAAEAVLENAFDSGGNIVLTAEIGSSNLEPEGALQLGVGDVVCVAPPQGGLLVRAGKKALWLAQSGAVGDSVAVSILSRYQGPEPAYGRVVAILGSTARHWKDVLALDSGDVLVLDRKLHSPVQLFLSGKLKAEGQVVVIDKRLGVRIKKLL